MTHKAHQEALAVAHPQSVIIGKMLTSGASTAKGKALNSGEEGEHKARACMVQSASLSKQVH